MFQTQSSLFALLLLTLCAACTQAPNCERSEVEQWKLGWRMIDNNWDDKHALAVEQFDSLRQCPAGMNIDFWYVGLKSVESLGDGEELRAILGEMDQDMVEKFSMRGLFTEELSEINPFVRPPFTHPELRMELIKILIDDQYCRGNPMDDVKARFDLEAYQPKDGSMAEVDAQNQIRVKAILDEYGFPRREMVGGAALKGVFMVIQHASSDQAWQSSQLPAVEAAVLRGDLDGQKYALLYDRIQLRKGEKQLYGTQASLAKDGVTLKLEPLEDPQNLDNRRRALGMCPIDMYMKVLKSM